MVLSGVVAQFLHLHDDDDMNSTTAGKLFGQFLLHTSALFRRLVRKGILFVSQSLLYSKALQLFNMHGKMWTQVGDPFAMIVIRKSGMGVICAWGSQGD